MIRYSGSRREGFESGPHQADQGTIGEVSSLLIFENKVCGYYIYTSANFIYFLLHVHKADIQVACKAGQNHGSSGQADNAGSCCCGTDRLDRLHIYIYTCNDIDVFLPLFVRQIGFHKMERQRERERERERDRDI